MRPIRSDSYAARPRSRCRRRRCGSTSLDSCNSASNNLPTLHCKFDGGCLISLDTFRTRGTEVSCRPEVAQPLNPVTHAATEATNKCDPQRACRTTISTPRSVSRLTTPCSPASAARLLHNYRCLPAALVGCSTLLGPTTEPFLLTKYVHLPDTSSDTPVA